MPTFKKNAGVKSILETVTNTLRGDGVLKGLVKYEPNDLNIRRGFQTSGKWERLISYWFQPEVPLGDFHPNFRQVPLIIGIWSRENELILHDISERLIQLLDSTNGTDLSKAGFIKVYSCLYDGELNEIIYDSNLKAYTLMQRYILTIRKEV